MTEDEEKELLKMQNFGTSEAYVQDAYGAPLRLSEFVDDYCMSCKDSMDGPHCMGAFIGDRRSESVTLKCPNCGEEQIMFSRRVHWRPEKEKVKR